MSNFKIQDTGRVFYANVAGNALNNPGIISGEYTPSMSSVAATVTDVNIASYTAIGNFMTVNGSFTLTNSFQSFFDLNISLPPGYLASDPANQEPPASGNCIITGGRGDSSRIAVSTDYSINSSKDSMDIIVTSSSEMSGTAGIVYGYSITYRI